MDICTCERKLVMNNQLVIRTPVRDLLRYVHFETYACGMAWRTQEHNSAIIIREQLKINIVNF